MVHGLIRARSPSASVHSTMSDPASHRLSSESSLWRMGVVIGRAGSAPQRETRFWLAGSTPDDGWKSTTPIVSRFPDSRKGRSMYARRTTVRPEYQVFVFLS